jgi:hypothetical protein
METEKYKIKFGSENINLQICDDYVEGYYFKKDNKIVMCANMLTNYEKSFMFDQALKRQVRLQ